MNFYTLYNFLPAPLVNKGELKKKYLELSKIHHPDFADSTDDAGMQNALELSSEINKAYKIFNNATLSIQYYLQYKKVIQEDEKYPLPHDFLMDMMDINESLEDAKASKDDKAIAMIKGNMETFEENLMEEIKDILDNHNNEIGDVDSLYKLKAYLYKKKYIHRILDGIS